MDNPLLGQPLEEGTTPPEQQLTDMSAITPTEHLHNAIVGNELRCSIHDGTCPVIFVKPTQVLEKGDDGELHLVDKG